MGANRSGFEALRRSYPGSALESNRCSMVSFHPCGLYYSVKTKFVLLHSPSLGMNVQSLRIMQTLRCLRNFCCEFSRVKIYASPPPPSASYWEHSFLSRIISRPPRVNLTVFSFTVTRQSDWGRALITPINTEAVVWSRMNQRPSICLVFASIGVQTAHVCLLPLSEFRLQPTLPTQ